MTPNIKYWLNLNQSPQGVRLIYGGDWRQRTQILVQLANMLSGEYVSVGQVLPEYLLKLPNPATRTRQLPTILSTILPKQPLVMVDHVEVLCQSDLHFALLDWFATWATVRAVILSWPGKANPARNVVSYAVPGHPDYVRVHVPQIPLISVTEAIQWL